MFDISKLQVAAQLGRAEEDRYKDIDGKPLPQDHIDMIDVFEDDVPDMPCSRPTFINAIVYDGILSLIHIQVDHEAYKVVSVRPVGHGGEKFPAGFFEDPEIVKAIYEGIRELPEYIIDRDLYYYAKLTRDQQSV